MNEIKYRKAIEPDIPHIIEIWKASMDFHRTRDSVFARSKQGAGNLGKIILGDLDKDDAVVHVAETDGKVVAYIRATIQSYPPVFEVKQYGSVIGLAVMPIYRRAGIGERLFEMVREWVGRKGVNRIEIEVAVTNEVSTSFWNKMLSKPSGCTGPFESPRNGCRIILPGI